MYPRHDPTQVILQPSPPSIEQLRAAVSEGAARPLKIAIVIGPGFIPMDIVGVQTVFGLVPGSVIHLVWKTLALVEGFPNWWTRPTTTSACCPPDLDVLAVPMMAPETQSDPEVIAFLREYGRNARYVIGVCNGVLALGAAGLLRHRRVTASYNALPILPELGVSEVVPCGNGVVVDGNLYTAGPDVGSFEAALLVAAQMVGQSVAEFIEFAIEYDPHPPFGTGSPQRAGPDLAARSEQLMAGLMQAYRSGSVDAHRRDPLPQRR
jgi:putative intracellular protease/amidase